MVADLAEIVGTEGDLITIDLADEFSALAPTEQRLALAQITYAMTQLPALIRVEFLVAGNRRASPVGDGSATDRPVSPVDYEEFAPVCADELHTTRTGPPSERHITQPL